MCPRSPGVRSGRILLGPSPFAFDGRLDRGVPSRDELGADQLLGITVHRQHLLAHSLAGVDFHNLARLQIPIPKVPQGEHYDATAVRTNSPKSVETSLLSKFASPSIRTVFLSGTSMRLMAIGKSLACTPDQTNVYPALMA